MSNRQLSKFMSGLMRHFPDEYDLEYNSQGWFEIDDLIECVNNKNNYSNIRREDIIQVVNEDEKGRYEINDSRDLIRAVYGHSINVDVDKNSNNTDVPGELYHGTPERNKKSILSNGIISKNRQSVHLTDSKSEALNVGKRHIK